MAKSSKQDQLLQHVEHCLGLLEKHLPCQNDPGEGDAGATTFNLAERLKMLTPIKRTIIHRGRRLVQAVFDLGGEDPLLDKVQAVAWAARDFAAWGETFPADMRQTLDRAVSTLRHRRATAKGVSIPTNLESTITAELRSRPGQTAKDVKNILDARAEEAEKNGQLPRRWTIKTVTETLCRMKHSGLLDNRSGTGYFLRTHPPA